MFVTSKVIFAEVKCSGSDVLVPDLLTQVKGCRCPPVPVVNAPSSIIPSKCFPFKTFTIITIKNTTIYTPHT